MPKYLPVELPPGFHNHGVDLDALNRWHDGNLVRWEQGSIRPVGGWRPLQRTKSDSTSEDVSVPAGIARAIHIWIDNGGEEQIAVGTNENLYASGVRLVLKDITPAGYTTGVIGENLGYGGKDFGRGLFGTPRISDGTPSPLSVWSFDNFGELLVAVASQDRNIYVWELNDGLSDVDSATAARLLSTTADGSLPTCDQIVVTPERFLFAMGAGANPRKIAWCDREDIDTWTPAVDNEAGDFELQTQGRIIGAAKVRGRTLIVTTTDAHTATYLGPPNVYGFQRVGVNCGAVSYNVISEAQFGAFWMGTKAFFVFDGSSVTQIPCEVEDKVFDDINLAEMRKAFSVTNDRSHEVWWFYPSAGSTEPNRYVAYDYLESHWITGQLERTTGADLGVYTDPIWINGDGDLYRHETGFNHGGEMPWAETGPIILGVGENVMHITRMIQDERTAGQASVSFDTNFWPDAEPLWEHGPYNLSNPTDLRFTGRQVRMRIEGQDDNDWRIGGIRLEYTAGGMR